MQKPKFTFDKLYYKLKDEKGITFNFHSKDEAIEIMKNRNYYYRLTSYRKNYDKINGKYIDLDFKALVDLASIDSYLREFLLSICLDVEHNAKTKIMTLITLNPNEDGYSIIQEFDEKYPKYYDNVMRNMEYSKYKKALRTKRRDDISIWVFLEFAGITETDYLIELYNTKYRNNEIKLLNKNLKYVRNIRNTCAHNNTFLVNIFDQTSEIAKPSQGSKIIVSELGIKEYWLHYMKCHDVIILFYLHSMLSSNELINRRQDMGKQLIVRADKNNDLHNLKIKGYFKFLSDLLD